MSRRAEGCLPCPECGLLNHDPTLARLGFCSRCEDFTGMCVAGRKIICPDVMTVTSWHAPCTNLGIVAWELMYAGRTFVARLCSVHDAEVNGGRTPWLLSAIRLDGQIGAETVPRPRSPA
jgi:hypothetical protein